MSRTLNKVQLIGRLGGDPELRYTQAGMARTTFSLATNRAWQDKDGNAHEETDWHSVVAWDKLAQNCAEYLSKGRLVYIEGRLQYRNWEFEGKTGTKAEIVALDMLILDSKPNGLSEPALVPEYASTETPARNNTQRAQVERVAPPPAASAPAAAAARTAPARQARTVVVEPEDDPDDLPF